MRDRTPYVRTRCMHRGTIALLLGMALFPCGLPWGQLLIPEDIPINQSKTSPPRNPAPDTPSHGGLENPSSKRPANLNISCPSHFVKNTISTIEVTAANASEEQRIGTIAVSFLGITPEVTKNTDRYAIIEPGGKVTAFTKNSDVWLPERDPIPTRNLLVEYYNPCWETGENATKTIQIPVRFATAGIVRILARASFAVKNGSQIQVRENLPGEGANDQQGLPCESLDVPVEETSGENPAIAALQPGTWNGFFENRGNKKKFTLKISGINGATFTAEGKADTWTLLEIFEGSVDRNSVTFKGVSVTPKPAADIRYSLDTMHMSLSPDGRTLSGYWEDTERSTGTVEIRHVE